VIELADTSAWIVSDRDQATRRAFDDALEAGEIATCDMVKLELLTGARNAAELTATRRDLEALPQCTIEPDAWRRALDVYEELARHGGSHHRRVSHPDLLIAAAAEAAGLGLVHYDADYEVIAAVTGQRTRWIVPRGVI
jgi:predicted nucleic acid-binding protein